MLDDKVAHTMLEELTLVIKMLNGLIAYRRQTVRERRAIYDSDAPNSEDTPFVS